MRKLSKKTLAIVTGTVVVAAGTGIAYAYWTTHGSGTSSNNSTGTAAELTIHQTSSAVNMGPGVPAQTLAGNFDNLNPGPAYIGTITATVTTNKAGCTEADFTLVQPTAVNQEIPAGSGVGAWGGGSIAFNNDPLVNQDVCKNATVTISYSTN